jgi:hypothetical protein
LHSLAQISSESRREISCQVFVVLLLCAQIDREEKLHELILRRRQGSNRASQYRVELEERSLEFNSAGRRGSNRANLYWLDSEEKHHGAMCRGRARVKPSEFPARRIVERASQRGSRRHGSNRAVGTESGSQRLGGTFEDTAWVKPSRDRGRHQKEELHGEIHRRQRG